MLASVIFLLMSCNKKEVVKLNFDVIPGRTTVYEGDTVTFSIYGNPDQVTFYSGENGFQYEHRERNQIEGVPSLQFTSYRQYGNQSNTLSVLISTDFSGNYTGEGIAAATWEDITSRATLSEGSDNTPSGLIDLSEFADKGPVYLAFRYTGVGGTTQRAWTIKNLFVKNKVEDGSEYPIATIANAGWVWVRLNPSNSEQRWQITETQLQFTGGPDTYGSNLGWVITKPLYLSKITPDTGVSLKNMSTRMDTYSYVFDKEGDYRATFVASNTNIYGFSSDMKHIDIKVIPRPKPPIDWNSYLEFTSYRQYGAQENTLSLLISTDFSGDYNEAGIHAATWEDITSLATLSTGTDNTPSGQIDLTPFNTGVPVYLAFRYTGVGGTTQRTWTIKNLTVENHLKNGSIVPVATIANAGWQWIRLNPSSSQQRWVITATDLKFSGGDATYGSNLGWVITKPLDLSETTP